MSGQRKRIDITSADSKHLGFEYQYLYFIAMLFHLRLGDEVGYEALDDIHVISNKEGNTYFYQIKHTIATTASGDQINLSALSEDLWKTLSNWSKLISDETCGRKHKAAQKNFISESRFVLVANRMMTGNEVLDNITKLVKNEINATDFSIYLKAQWTKTKDQLIKSYISDVLSLGDTVISAFVKKIVFTNSQDDLFDLIREGILDKMVRQEYVNEVLADLYLQLKIDFFDKVKNRQHQTITYTEWINKYQGIFQQYRTTQLPVRAFNPILPDHLEKQAFAQELIEIGVIDIHGDGLSQLFELTNHYLCFKMQIDGWYEEGRVTRSVLQRFHDDAILEWKNIHRQIHRATNRNIDLDFQNALGCFDKTMSKKLMLLSTDLGMSFSNGEFIYLADEEIIGWKYCWKDRYYV